MILSFSISLLLAVQDAPADPPNWAQAHGHRAKHERRHDRQQRRQRHRNRLRSHEYTYRDDDDSSGGTNNDRYRRPDDRYAERWEHARDRRWRDEEWAPYEDWRNTHRPRELAILDGRCQRERANGVSRNVAQLGDAVSAMRNGDLSTLAVLGLQEYLLGRSAPDVSVDRSDHYCFGQALEHARDGRDVMWDNPDLGSSYLVSASKPFRRAGRYCREYTSQIKGRSGKTIREQGIACRGEDGRWQALN
ncbi:MAG: hypothetical protein ACREWG_00920 [Gammaproteobacteria bacterium]